MKKHDCVTDAIVRLIYNEQKETTRHTEPEIVFTLRNHKSVRKICDAEFGFFVFFFGQFTYGQNVSAESDVLPTSILPADAT